MGETWAFPLRWEPREGWNREQREPTLILTRSLWLCAWRPERNRKSPRRLLRRYPPFSTNLYTEVMDMSYWWLFCSLLCDLWNRISWKARNERCRETGFQQYSLGSGTMLHLEFSVEWANSFPFYLHCSFVLYYGFSQWVLVFLSLANKNMKTDTSKKKNKKPNFWWEVMVTPMAW